jgi:heat shock protein HslJ
MSALFFRRREALMNTGPWFAFAAAFTVALSACGGRQVQVVGTGGDRVTATITYSEAAPLPADAELDAWIADASPMPTIQALVAQGTLPMRERETTFALRYDGDRITDDHTYVLKAVVRSGGQILLATDADTLVITRGHSNHATLVLRPVVQTPTASVAPGAQAGPAQTTGLTGSSWRLEDLAGTPAVAGVEATLEFVAGDRVSGNASCNRFNGTAKVSGSSITLGPLTSTRMACTSEAANAQETAYLKALNDAERFVLEGVSLQIFSKGQTNSLRFARRP